MKKNVGNFDKQCQHIIANESFIHDRIEKTGNYLEIHIK